MITRFRRFLENQQVPMIEAIFVPLQGNAEVYECLAEGKWIDGRFKNNIRIDQPTHGVGQKHAHVYGRTHDDKLGVINFDGTGSHGTRMRLHKKDFKSLRSHGVNVRRDRIVEWQVVDVKFLLVEG